MFPKALNMGLSILLSIAYGLGLPSSNFARRAESSAHVPMLWIYTMNDSYFGPDLSSRMANAVRMQGTDLDYHLLPAFQEDGHFLIDNPDAIKILAPLVTQFLSQLK